MYCWTRFLEVSIKCDFLCIIITLTIHTLVSGIQIEKQEFLLITMTRLCSKENLREPTALKL